MHERCPVCDLRFEREQGYFLGAMYVSYALGLAVLGSLVILTWWLVGLENPWNLAPSVVISSCSFPRSSAIRASSGCTSTARWTA